jgi:OOP family OmpA-OmpF porin
MPYMKLKLATSLLTGAIIGSLGSTGFAAGNPNNGAGQFYGGLNIGGYHYDKDRDIKNTFPLYGAQVGYQVNSVLGIELGYQYGRTETCHTDHRVIHHQPHVAFLAHIPEASLWGITPYLVASVSHLNLDIKDRSDITDTLVGGGLGVQKFLTPSLALRTDVRSNWGINHARQDFQYAVALNYFFGSPRQTSYEPEPTPVPVKTKTVAEPVTITMNVEFDFDKSKVKPEYKPQIKRVADFMDQYPETQADLEGHTDSTGSEAYNLKLSQRRANAVKDVLVDDFNVPADRVTAKGYGEAHPVASNATPEGRAHNRRVDAIISTTVEKEVAADHDGHGMGHDDHDHQMDHNS